MSTLARPRIDPLPTPSPSEFSSPAPVKIDVDGLNFYYSERRVLDDIHVKIRPHEVTALIGPSGCGKSTFLRTLNRMNDIVPGARVRISRAREGNDLQTRMPATPAHSLPSNA